MNEYVIRNAEPSDYEAILNIYSIARQFMKNNGNPKQWGDNFPPVKVIEEDIALQRNYVITLDDVVIGVFAFIIGEDPTYNVIENGCWRSDSLYGTIHRIASDGSCHGLANACFDFCLDKVNHLRIDTHAQNVPMQSAIRKYGFSERGIIYVADKTPRIAFDYLK